MFKVSIRDFNSFLNYDNLLLIFNLFGFANFLSLYFYKKNLIDSIILIKQNILRDFLLFVIFFVIFIVVLKIIFFVIKGFKIKNLDLNESSEHRIGLSKIRNKAIIKNNKALYDFYESKKREVDDINKSFLLHLGCFVVCILNWNFFVSLYNDCKEHFMSLQCLLFIAIILMFLWSFMLILFGNIDDEWNTYIDADIKRFIEKDEK